MSQSISLWGANYTNVPYLTVPKTGGGNARFDDASVTTATAPDVTAGKIFVAADGTITTGTNSGGGGGSSVQVGYEITEPSSVSSSLQFTGLLGEPTSFFVYCWPLNETLSTSSPANVAAVVFDGQSLHGQTVSTTANANASYDTGFTKSYSNGTLTIAATTAQFVAGEWYVTYTYGGTAACINTKDVQVGSGVTSITFTGLEDEPLYWSCIFKSNFSTSSGYQRVMAVSASGSDPFGFCLDSSAHYSDTYWTYSYSNGSLTITSNGTNAGGYFHQPGYYQLTYAYDATGNYQSKTVTPTESQQVVQADSGYDALKKVTVNPIPSQYIVPTGNLPITSNGNNIDVAQYETVSVNVSGGGSVSYDTKTVTASNYPVSLDFTSMKGQPKFFVVRLNASVSSSGNTTYYYIVDIASNGTTTHGNCFRIGSTRQVTSITSGYSWSYSGTTLTITSSAASRSASPGAFYNGSYELMYAY